MNDKKKCFEMCVNHDVSCPVNDCKYWINYKKDLNCAIICANQHGPLSLREVADRIGVSFVRVKQIQDMTVEKFTKRLATLGITATEVKTILAALRSGEEDHSLME